MATFTLVGLGNPGEEYEGTRHNAGRIVLEYVAKKNGFSDFVMNGKLNAREAKGEIAGKKVVALEPETYMNKSGATLKLADKGAKDIEERLIVIYDDMDLPLGTFKLSYNRSSGGHRGLESVIKALKTEKFARIRIGICPTTPTGKPKKPKGEDKVLDFIVGPFKDKELDEVKKVAKRVNEVLETFVAEGREKATSQL